jgi:hypothetical protein
MAINTLLLLYTRACIAITYINITIDAITFTPPPELKDAASLYISVGNTILAAFPEIAAQITKQSGKI